MKLKISRELKTGMIAVLGIALFIYGYNFLKKQSIFEKEQIFHVTFDNVQGLSNSSPVTLNGLQVGNIKAISFNKEKKGSFIVDFNITKDIEFSKNSIAKIIPPTISGMGSAQLAIEADFKGEPAKSGDYLKGSVAPGLMAALTQKIDPLNQQLNSVLTNTDKLLVNLNTTLDSNTQKNLQASIANLNASLNSFKNISKNFDQLLIANKEKFNSILNSADASGKSLAKMTSDLEKAELSKDLKNTMIKLDQSLTHINSIMSKMNKGEGSIGKLLKDEGLYNNLENSAKEMEELLREMKLHPKRFVHFSLFGKKDKGYDNQETNK